MPGKREGSLLGLYVTAVLLLSDFFRNLFFVFFFSAVLSLLNARDIVSNLAPESVGAYFSPQDCETARGRCKAGAALLVLDCENHGP